MPTQELHRYVVVYDIANDRRRTRIFKILGGYGYAVQYSVFEVQVTPADFLIMTHQLKKAMKRDEDSIVCYRLCHRCCSQVLRLGQSADPYSDAFVLV